MFRNLLETSEEYELADMLHPQDVQTLVNLQLQQMRDEATQDGETLDENFSDYIEAFDGVLDMICRCVREEKLGEELDRTNSTTVAMEIAFRMLEGHPDALDVVEEELLENARSREQQPQSRGRYTDVELQRRQQKPEFHSPGF